MGKFADQVVWITGASSGIGEALAYAFAKEGARLVLSARRVAELERVKNSCNRREGDILVLPLDLNDYENLPEKVDKVMASFGKIDVLINNGGISQRALIKDTEISVFKRLMDVNYLGTVALTKAVLPIFVQQQKGHFAVITSLMGKFASPLRSGYCGAKHALHGFFDALRLEHEDDQIDVTLVCPGFISTNISMSALQSDGSAQQSMDQSTAGGMSADRCAEKILSAIAKKKFEVNIGGKETLAIYVKRFFPKLLHKIVKKSAVT